MTMFLLLGVQHTKKPGKLSRRMIFFRASLSGPGLIILASQPLIHGRHAVRILVSLTLRVFQKISITCIRLNGQIKMYCIYFLTGTGTREIRLIYGLIITTRMKWNRSEEHTSEL